MEIDKIIKENINKLINESMDANSNNALGEIFSKMDYQIHIETINLNKKERYYEEIKRLVNIYQEEIQQLGLQYSSIDVEYDDDNTEIVYYIQGSEQWTEDDFMNIENKLRSFQYDNNNNLPYYYIDEMYNRNDSFSGCKIVLSIPVAFE